MSTRTRYWLMKSEPDDFSIDDLARVQVEPWTGVRNYQARNFMRQMQVGDGVLFYHSNAKVPGIYGIAEVACTAYPDPTQFERTSTRSQRGCSRVAFWSKYLDVRSNWVGSGYAVHAEN